MKSFYSTTRSSAAQQGHTLVELLVAISLGSVVLAFLGGVLLVSEMRVSARIQRNLDAKDDANRAIDLIRREANFSSRIDSGDASFSSPLACDVSTLIFYQKDPARPICYKTVSPDKLPQQYTGAFQGPCVLVRIGYPYSSTGEIDVSSPNRLISVLLDGVKIGSNSDCSSEGFTSQLASSPFPTNTPVAPPNRIANAQIMMASSANYDFSMRVPSNLAYDGMDLLRYCAQQNGICESNSTQVHYLPEAKGQLAFTASESKENLFYFIYPFAKYNVTTCTYSNCTVTDGGSSFELANVDALIFPDKEIRPTR
jgi:prepilin-type N-terminal cleavage/methylation domain-containing protein